MSGGPNAGAALALRPDHLLHRWQRPALAVGVLALAAAAAGALLDPVQFFRSYLLAYLFWSGIALGALAILMLQHVTGGAWGSVIRRALESATRTLPLLVVLFLPLVLGLSSLYEWARPAEVAHDPLLQHKRLYLNVPFFLARAAFYFTAWLILVQLLNRWSAAQDATRDPRVTRRMEYLSRGGLLLYGLTMTFASIDWVMSLEPHWFSTIYGILFIGGQILTAFAFVIPVVVLLADRPPLSGIISAQHFHDLGKLLLAFVMVYTYFALSQFLIIWAGNLPEETPWYLSRLRGGWQWFGVALIVFQFALPFAVLLSRDLKRSGRALAVIALLVFAMRLVDLNWLVTPAFFPGAFAVHWLDVVAFAGVGGLWLGVFLRQLRGRPLVPLHDPSLPLEASA